MPEAERREAPSLDVAYVARLARLRLTDEEAALFQAQLGSVLGYVRKLQQLELTGVEPTSHPYPLRNVFRADEVRHGLETETVLANAPATAQQQFIVPRIVE
jgi:aspartyl-tRNA(Asn)/glutamyl-tRNA(Gln) amidotransferase subunit C